MDAADHLRGHKDWLTLSLDDQPKARKRFAGFDVKEVTMRKSANISATSRLGKVLVSR